VASRNRNLNGRLYEVVDELVRRGVPLEQARREFERQFIVAALRKNDGNFSQSALSIHLTTAVAPEAPSALSRSDPCLSNWVALC
jgi:hypothetical protein